MSKRIARWACLLVGVAVAVGLGRPAAAAPPEAPTTSTRNPDPKARVAEGVEAGVLRGDLVDCSGTVPESEPSCGLPFDFVNGGCGSFAPLFSQLQCGFSYCGTAAFNGIDRDTDWWQLVVAEETTLTWTVTAEFRVLIGFISGTGGVPDCQLAGQLNPFAIGDPGQEVSVTVCVGPGTWWFFVAPDFSSPPFTCAQELRYRASISCSSPCVGGACCLADGTCVEAPDVTECVAMGGTFQGTGTVCEVSTCDPPANDLCDGAELIACGQSVQADLRNATLTLDEPEVGCFGAATNASVWYRFVGTGDEVELTTCASTAGDPLARDSIIAVYVGACDQLTFITCSDDSGCGPTGRLTRLCIDTIPGADYFVQLLAFDDQSRGVYTLELLCPCENTAEGACCLPDGACVQEDESTCEVAPGIFFGAGVACDDPVVDCPDVSFPPNDDCFSAEPVAVPSVTPGYTYFSFDDFSPDCGLEIDGPGVWYTFVGNGETVTVDLCSPVTNFDAKLHVYCGDCNVGQEVCVAANDDGPGACVLSPSVTLCTQSGEQYYVLVSGFEGSVGEFELSVTSDGEACDFPPFCEQACVVGCPAGASDEGEPDCVLNYTDVTNAGCGAAGTPVFGSIACGETVCGTSGTFVRNGGLARDVDYFEFTLNAQAEVSWTVEAEFLVQALILNDQCGAKQVVLASATGAGCQPARATALLEPGVYRVFVSPQFFEGVDCGSVWSGTLECVATPENGACCIGIGECIETTADGCAFQGGAFAGVGTSCATITCEAACPGDLDGDFDVDFDDLAILLGAFGQTAAGDIDGDADTDFDDLAILLGAFEQPCG